MKYCDLNENIKKQLRREWIITNGIGGFCSGSVLGGCNIRKYNGLLVAPLTPPARRFLVLSKLDESIKINGQDYNLYTNITNNLENGEHEISEGFKYLKDFINNTYIKDVIERNNIKNNTVIDSLFNILASSIGSLTNPTKLANTFTGVVDGIGDGVDSP